MLFLLLSNPEALKKVVQELDENFSDPDEPIPISVLNKLPYLNAMIYDSLRLGTSLAGRPRTVDKGGFVVEGTFIPEGTAVSVNPYVQQTSPENFYPEPIAYKPERWLPGGLGPGTITRKTAILSFSFGMFRLVTQRSGCSK